MRYSNNTLSTMLIMTDPKKVQEADFESSSSNASHAVTQQQQVFTMHEFSVMHQC